MTKYTFNPFTGNFDQVLNLENPLQFKGTITISSDFPTSSEVKSGWFYKVTADVTDDDVSKTNTGQSFQSYDEIVWNGSSWDVMGNLRDVDYIQFDLDVEHTHQEGKLAWNSDDGTLEVGMPGGNVAIQIGQESVIKVKATEDILNGQPIYISGAVGSRPEASLANATNHIVATSTIAVATEDIASGQQGYATSFGIVRGIDTSFAFSDGAPAFLSTTDGVLSGSLPTQPDSQVFVGVVLRKHADEGVLFVKIIPQPNLDELSNVLISSIADNDFIYWDNATSTWKNKQITGSDIGGFTEGSIPFANSSGVLTEDNSDLFWDNTNKRLGVGTNVPGRKFSVVDGSWGLDLGDGYFAGGQIDIIDFAFDSSEMKFNHPELIYFGDIEGENEELIFTIDSINGKYTFENGNIGIATTSPEEKLHVYSGNIKLGYDAGSDVALQLTGGGSSTRAIEFNRAGATDNSIYQDDSESLFINYQQTDFGGRKLEILRGSAGTQVATFDENGYLGLGTTTPSVLNHIDSTIGHAPMTLGTASGMFALTVQELYGMFTGVYGTGDVWTQVGRMDGTPTAYNLLLQPNGGFVGIGTGTASPSKELEVLSTTTNPTIRINKDVPTGGYADLNMGTGKFNIDINGNRYLTILDTGEIGIGTSTPADILEVSTSTVGEGAIIGNAKVGVWDANDAYAMFRHKSAGGGVGDYALIQASGGGTLLNSKAGQSLKLRIGNSDAIFIDSTKKVGIGTNLPEALLEVQSTVAYGAKIRIDDASAIATSFAALEFYNDNVNYVTSQLRSYYGSGYVNPKFEIWVADASKVGQNRLTINKEGYVGIGTNSPNYKFEVRDTVASGAVSMASRNLDNTGYANLRVIADASELKFSTYGSNYPSSQYRNIGLLTVTSDELRICSQGVGGVIGFYTEGIDSSKLKMTIDSDGNVIMPSDSAKLFLGVSSDMSIGYDGTDAIIDTGVVNPSDLIVDCGTEKTLELAEAVWDDLLISTGLFNFAGVTDPTWRDWQPTGSGTTFKILKFNKNDEVFFSCQLPHTYKEGTDIRPHVHWTPCDQGTAESGSYVGWKLDYSWANINGDPFPVSGTITMTDACTGTDDYHEVGGSESPYIDGTGKTVSSMLICRLYREDTGADDTWSGTGADAPAMLQFDFHHEIDTQGSRQEWVK